MNANQTRAKYFAVISTVIYGILFPLFTWMALLWSASSDSSKTLEFFTIFSWFWVPISMPFSIYLMWSKYRTGKYKHTIMSCALPFLAFAAFLIMNAAIRALDSLDF
jgi:hypothetical protein